MDKPLVSIIIPTYNVERYVEECIDSVLGQTYKNIEIIVIDDGSTDATPYLLKPYEEQLTLILNEINQGQGAVRNQGIEKASGEFLLFVDADDWIERETVVSLVSKAIETDADLIRFNGQSFSENHTHFENSVEYNFSAILHESETYERPDLLKKNQRAYSASPCLYMVKKSVVDEHAIRFPEGVLHEDEYFTTLIFLLSKRMSYLNKVFYHRRYRVASTMTESTPLHKKKSFDSYIRVFKLLETHYYDTKYTPEQKDFLKRQLLSIYNGLQRSPIEPSMKKAMNDISSITLLDRARITISRVLTKLDRFKF